MASIQTINEAEFEARWNDAMKLSALPKVDLSPDDPAEFPEYLLPQGILDWIREVADACFEKGLIDDTKYGVLVCNIKEQASVFSGIDQDELRTVIARIDAIKTDAD